jgi:Flp pilus assembly protein TadG
MVRILRKLGRSDGAEIAEAALVLPVVFILLLGIVWFGRAFQIYSTITQAAQQGANTAARPLCIAAACGSNFPGDPAVDNSVSAVLQASSLDPSQILTSPNPSTQDCALPGIPPPACSTTSHNIVVCRQVALNTSSTPVQCGVVVTFQYPFQFHVPFTSLGANPTVLTGQAQSRMEN